MQLTGIACAVPRAAAPIFAAASAAEAQSLQRIVDNTGVRSRRISAPSLCTSDLCFTAADALLNQAGVDRATVDALIFVTQTADYLIPSSAGILQSRLGLSTRALTIDVNQGCAGFTHGLILAQGLIGGAGLRRVLLLAGDTLSKCVSPQDPGTAYLFGDAGSAALLEATADGSTQLAATAFGSDGAGALHIHQRIGYRQGFDLDTAPASPGSDLPAGLQLHLDGSHVFAFTLKRVPPLARELLAAAQWPLESVDAFVLHQANRFMLEHLAKRIGVPAVKLPMSLEQFGNTSSASIPLTMVTAMRDRLAQPLRLVMLGFGVGLAWSGVAMATSRVICPALIEID